MCAQRPTPSDIYFTDILEKNQDFTDIQTFYLIQGEGHANFFSQLIFISDNEGSD